MSDEKPLHVQVAEALWWTEIVEAPFMPVTVSNWLGKPPAWDRDPHQYVAHVNHETRALTIGAGSIPRYDTDWSATGPLIEKYGIEIAPPVPESIALIQSHQEWVARADQREDETFGVGATGPTPLLAVCHLILALHAAGKLEPTS